jgi:hypothetical protein
VKRALAALGLCILAAGCSKTTPKTSPCDLLSLGEAQSLDAAVAKTQAFPPQKGEELCVFTDQGGDARLMLFVWRGKSLPPIEAVRAGMKGGDRVVEVGGVGNSAAAGFSAAEGEALKLFAAQSSSGMVGLRVRDPVKFGDEKFNNVRALAGKALGRLK